MARPEPEDVTRVACVGAGTIGGGWAVYFLAQGMDVVASDPGNGASEMLERIVAGAWPKLESLGLAPGADRSRLSFTASIEEAVAEADFIQESAPDNEDLKIELFERIGQAAPSDTVISSSSSKFLPSRLSQACAHPERCIVGHPFAPSYLIPLVEVVGGEKTTDDVLDWAVRFYRHAGKKPLRLKKEIEAYVANRIQHAVLAEAASLVDQGVCDFEDIDDAVAYGPGLRWAFAGPPTCYHMGGGKGGVRHMLDHFGWSYGSEGNAEALVESIDNIAGHVDMDTLEGWRDDNLLSILKGIKPLPSK